MIGLGSDPGHLLAIYLNDHLAAAAGGVEMARRLRGSNEDDADFGRPIAEICAEVEEDRETLKALVAELGIRRDPVKPVFAWGAEKLGRLKLNGQITGYSPLSRMMELEILYIGITGKKRMWRALEESLGDAVAGFDFGVLAERAARQRETVGELHLLAAGRALGAPA